MLSFFDPRGTMGRQDFILSTLLRDIYLGGLWLVFLVAGLFFAIDGPVTEASMTKAIETSLQSNLTYLTAFFSLLGFFIYTPIDIRRACDMHMDLKWLVPGCLMYFLPTQMMMEFGPTLGFLVLLGAYKTVVSLILVFKTGETYKAYIRGE